MARTRRRVAIERITGDAARQVSFSKRRQGLFKKVCELSTLCGAESAVLVHSPAGRVYSLGDPDVITVVDRFLEYASQTENQQGESSVRHQPQQPQSQPQEGRRRVLEEELYSQLAEQEAWGEVARVQRTALVAAMKDKEEALPHRWGAKVQDLSLQESEEMADMLEELALCVGDLIRQKEVEEGVPPDHRWSPDDPAPVPVNPWRQAAFMASLGHAAPWGAAPGFMGPAAADNAAMAGGFHFPFGGPAFGASTSAAPVNPFAAPAPPSLESGLLLPGQNHAAPELLAASAGMGVPMAPGGGSRMVGLASTAGAASFDFGASSSSGSVDALIQAWRDGEGSSTGFGPQSSRFH